ncbi:MAG: DUF1292 domain-containing protein [Oscillospiraceae bacterium]|jgi:uncharacterized protein YrzB (UPF0473 family)|nr:DUF1292 domain-containing protein [Oscillospiraceae bacterium]
MSEEYGADFITLTDDEGNEFELEHLDTLEVDGETYMAFAPTNTGEDDEEIEVIVLKVAVEDNEEIFVTVDDDDELDRIYEMFVDRFDDEENLH